MEALNNLEQSLVNLRDLLRFKAQAEKELADLRVEVSRQKYQIKDLRSKNAALEKLSDVLSPGDENYLMAFNATIECFRPSKGGKRVTVRSRRGRVLAEVHDDEKYKRSLIKRALKEARAKHVWNEGNR